MTKPCLELVVYNVQNAEDARRVRREVQNFVKSYDGFLSWAAYEGSEDANQFTDVVMWESLEAAKAGSEKFTSDARCKAVMEQIDAMVTMCHYFEDQTVYAQKATEAA